MTLTAVAESNEGPDPESLATQRFLQALGQRVRQHRTRARMSRKRLAEISGVSERYLAQLESGQGNMSIALLRKVARAIEMRLDVLMADLEPQPRAPEPMPEPAHLSATPRPADAAVTVDPTRIPEPHRVPEMS